MATVSRARAVAWWAATYAEKVRPRIERVEQLMRMGMPELQVLALMCDLDTSAKAIMAAERIAKQRWGLFVFAGPLGTGKSLGAAAWAQLVTAHWMTAEQIGNLPPIDIANAIARLVNLPALVIDEVGGQASTSERAASLIGAVLTRRHAACRPTLVTTNMQQETFAEHLDGVHAQGNRTAASQSRICDRIVEQGEWIVVGGKSRRSAPLPIEAKREQLKKWRKLVHLAEVCDDVARGVQFDSPAIEDVVELCGLTDAKLDEARETIAKSDARIDELVTKLREGWRLSEADAAAESA